MEYKTVKIGFTGSRDGMTLNQIDKFGKIIAHELGHAKIMGYVLDFHHGGCQGADTEASKIVYNQGTKIDPASMGMCSGTVCITVHPPLNQKLVGDYYWINKEDPLPYLERNRAIVDATDWLIATPKSADERLMSGSRYTINYAKRVGKKVVELEP